MQCVHATRRTRHLHPLRLGRRRRLRLAIRALHDLRPDLPLRVPLHDLRRRDHRHRARDRRDLLLRRLLEHLRAAVVPGVRRLRVPHDARQHELGQVHAHGARVPGYLCAGRERRDRVWRRDGHGRGDELLQPDLRVGDFAPERQAHRSGQGPARLPQPILVLCNGRGGAH